MDKGYPLEAWKRLGKDLEARRGQLGYGFRQRENFLADHGGPPPSLKMVARLERGERTSYPPGTVALLESLYELPPGSFEAFLKAVAAGRDARLLPADPVPVPPLLRPVPSPAAAGPAERAAQEILDNVLPQYPDDEVAQAVAAQRDKTALTRVLELRFARNPRLDHEVLAALLAGRPDDPVAQSIGRRGEPDADLAGEVLDWLGSQYPHRPQAREGNGTAG